MERTLIKTMPALLADALKTPEGRAFMKLSVARTEAPELASKVVTG